MGLDQQAQDAEDRSGTNICGFLHWAVDAEHAARLFTAKGWSVRASSWTEYEAECASARLEVLPVSPVTYNGFATPHDSTRS
ncbi:hypothetical protein [Streptomyces indicus]|uniref:Uncharacterized protein n=1 Tax=Streptomyces indicus TaxID=417292 RepID=A0A1G9CMK2_9ACTN|nr:hypothetical protein [Streptomyces indicus]SDK52819.1 hypothetical protein SAMN05421806_108209 [Streptomyces indicus]